MFFFFGRYNTSYDEKFNVILIFFPYLFLSQYKYISFIFYYHVGKNYLASPKVQMEKEL